MADAYNNSYTYDSEGQNTGARLWSGGSVSYIYDAAGQRIEKDYGSAVTDTIFFGGEPLARYPGGAWTDLIYGLSGLLAEVPGTQNGAPVYRITDHLGTGMETISSTGVLLSASDYSPLTEPTLLFPKNGVLSIRFLEAALSKRTFTQGQEHKAKPQRSELQRLLRLPLDWQQVWARTALAYDFGCLV